MAKKTKEAKDYLFLNNLYLDPVFEKRAGKSYMTRPDVLITVYRDNDTGHKSFTVKEEPEMKFYLALPEVEFKHPVNYIKRELVEEHVCKYRDIPLYLAREQDLEQDYWDTMRQSPYQAKQKYHLAEFAFETDLHVQDYYKGRFQDTYESSSKQLHKAYYDIEVDGIDHVGFPKEDDAPCPINAITVIDSKSNISYTFLLRNDKNPLIAKFEKNMTKFIKRCKEHIDENMEYDIRMFDDEMDMIEAFFKCVNEEINPDFNCAWNQRFDMLTLKNRVEKHHGYEFKDFICHPDFLDKKLGYFNYYDDVRQQKAADKGDWTTAASYTQWIDLYLLFAALRKGSGERDSYTLNNIAQEELGDNKLDYSESGDIKTLPYEDYELFVLYNIKDVHLLYRLETKNSDVDMLYSLSEITRTRLDKTMRKTVSLKNLAVKFYHDKGLVMGNNRNAIKAREETGPKEKFVGAVVGDPALNQHTGMVINGKKSKSVYEYVIDFDMTALYPSIIRAFNIDGSTQYGRIIIDGVQPTKEYSPGGVFVDQYETGNKIELGKQWFGLPSTTKLAEAVRKKYANKVGA